jgi:hypothetical protein
VLLKGIEGVQTNIFVIWKPKYFKMGLPSCAVNILHKRNVKTHDFDIFVQHFQDTFVTCMKYTDNFTWPVHVQNFISSLSFATFAAIATRVFSAYLAATFHTTSETTGSNTLH